jgi:hypothetical protein
MMAVFSTHLLPALPQGPPVAPKRTHHCRLDSLGRRLSELRSVALALGFTRTARELELKD